MSTRDEDYVPLPADQGHGIGVWILFLAGPVLWFTHFMLVYSLAEVLCKPLADVNGAGSLPLISVLTIGSTIIFALATTAGAVLAYRRWRAWQASRPSEERLSVQGEVLVSAGFLLGVLFTIAVIFTGVPALALQPC